MIDIVDVEINYPAEKMNETVADVKYGRERVRAKIVERSPDDDKSQKSRKKRKTITHNKSALSGAFASINDSAI